MVECRPSKMPAKPPTSDNHREDRLTQVLTEYLEAGESGTEPDRAALLAANPEVADELADFLSAVAEVDRFTRPLRQVAARVPAQSLPRSFGDYELLAQIGKGGMGVVYRARQLSLNRFVAVKLIREARPVSGWRGPSFRLEAEAAAHLDHPGIVPVYEIGEYDYRPFFSMKLLEGGSLAEHLPEYHAHPRRAVELVGSIARAVHHAHQRGILHRDLKPSNILLDAEGRPHIADFGLAKWLDVDHGLTQTGIIVGTPAYMAPEQASPPQERELRCLTTSATDVYGLGAILYSVLAGRPPFQGTTPLDTLVAVREHEVLAPTRFNQLVDRDLETICLKCLEKDPARRYGSALALAEELERWQAGEPILARPIGSGERARRWCRRNPLRATLTAAVALLLMLGLASLATGYVLLSRAHDRAEAHRRTAEQHESSLRRRLYAVQMGIGYRHWERGELDELASLLEESRNERDLTGFEWRWLDARARAKPREAAQFLGHQGTVFSAAYSADGKTAATCGEDRTVRLWDTETGALRATLRPRPATSALPLKGHTEDENCVGLSPDGRLLASGCEDGSVRLWDLATETWQPLAPGHQGEVLSLEFSRDGRWLVTAGVDRAVRVWDVLKPGSHVEFREHSAPVHGAAFSPDGKQIASADRNGVLHFWDRESRHVRWTIRTGDSMYCVAISPDGSRLATGDIAGAVRLWDASTGGPIREIDRLPGKVQSLDFSPDGNRVASAGDFGCVRVNSISSGELLNNFKAHAERIWCIRFSPDGTRLLTASGDATARVWGLAARTWSPRWSAAPAAAVERLSITPRGHSVSIVTNDGRIALGNALERGPFTAIPVPASPRTSPAFSPNGKELAFVGRDGEIRRWLTDENRELPVFTPRSIAAGEPEGEPNAIVLAYVGDKRLAALRRDGSLFVCDSAQWRDYRMDWHSKYLAPLFAPLPDGKTIVFCESSGPAIRFWNLDRERLAEEIPYSASDVGACSPDGSLIAFGESNGNISIVELTSRKNRPRLVGHRLRVATLAFSPDGKTLASGSHDGTVRLWHVGSGQELFVIEDRRGRAIRSLAFSADGRLLAVGGDPHENGSTVSVYDAGPPE